MHRSPASVAIAGMLALAVAMGVGRFAYTPLMPMMEDDAGLTLAAGSWLAAVNYIGYLLGALTAAALPLRSATAIRLGLAVICASTLGMGLLHDYAAWLALRALA
ncbi:MAG TPA: YbfB/YjiJ family MFS transporter, partial [Burkholderiales bacterium]